MFRVSGLEFWIWVHVHCPFVDEVALAIRKLVLDLEERAISDLALSDANYV